MNPKMKNKAGKSERKKEIKRYGQSFRLFREQMGLGQTEFGKLIGKSKATVSLYETDKRLPSIRTFLWYMENMGDLMFCEVQCPHCDGEGVITIAKLNKLK